MFLKDNEYMKPMKKMTATQWDDRAGLLQDAADYIKRAGGFAIDAPESIVERNLRTQALQCQRRADVVRGQERTSAHLAGLEQAGRLAEEIVKAGPK